MQAGLGVSTEEEILGDLDSSWEIACEIEELAQKQGKAGGWPMCGGAPAEWVGWRPNCCPDSPKYLLMCSGCKAAYQRWLALGAALVCGWCGTNTGGFVSYTPLNKAA